MPPPPPKTPPLNAMVLPSPGAVPPIVMSLPPTLMPTRWFPRSSVPVTSVPMKFPWIDVSRAADVEARVEADAADDVAFAGGAAADRCFPSRPRRCRVASSPSTIVPVTSVPMKLPWTVLPEPFAPIPLPKPAMTLRPPTPPRRIPEPPLMLRGKDDAPQAGSRSASPVLVMPKRLPWTLSPVAGLNGHSGSAARDQVARGRGRCRPRGRSVPLVDEHLVREPLVDARVPAASVPRKLPSMRTLSGAPLT